MRSRSFLALLALLAALAAFTGVADAAATTKKLRISGWSLPFNLPVMVERESGTYEAAFPDFDVSIVDLQTGPRLLTALATGDVDIVQGVGDAAFLVAYAAGLDARVIAINSRSPKAFGIVAGNPDIRTMEDLRGRKVAGLRGSVVHEVFVKALAEHGMTERDVEFFPMPVATAASTLLAGRVDAALLVGVELLRAARSGGRLLADGEERVRGISFVIASRKFIDEHRDAVDRYLEMRKKTIEYIDENPEEAAEIAARRTGLEPSDIEAMTDWYDFDMTVKPADISSIDDTMEYLIESGTLAAPVDVSGMFMD